MTAVRSRRLMLIVVAALAVLLGHAFSVFLKFKGGKAVATFIGAFAYVAPLPVLAIGGIDEVRAEAAAKAGAAGVAAIGLFIPPAGVPVERHLERVIATLRRVFDTCGVVP